MVFLIKDLFRIASCMAVVSSAIAYKCTKVNGILHACDLELNQFTLAGTHNSFAGTNGKLLDYWTRLPVPSHFYRNQYKSLETQLSLGIRYFDADASYANDRTKPHWRRGIHMVHNGAWANITLTEVLDGIAAFLDKDENRDEVVVIRMKDYDYKEQVGKLLFCEILPNFINNTGHKVTLNAETNPKLRDAIEQNSRIFLFVNGGYFEDDQNTAKYQHGCGPNYQLTEKFAHSLLQHESWNPSGPQDISSCEMKDATQTELEKRKDKLNDTDYAVQVDWYLPPTLIRSNWEGARRCEGTVGQVKDLNKYISDTYDRPINLLFVDDTGEVNALVENCFLWDVKRIVDDINYDSVGKWGGLTDNQRDAVTNDREFRSLLLCPAYVLLSP